MTEFREEVLAQELLPIDVNAIAKICTRWDIFSAAISLMDKREVLKTLKYLMEYRPYSRTFGERAVQRYNSINRVSWGELYHGDRKTGGATS